LRHRHHRCPPAHRCSLRPYRRLYRRYSSCRRYRRWFHRSRGYLQSQRPHHFQGRRRSLWRRRSRGCLLRRRWPPLPRRRRRRRCCCPGSRPIRPTSRRMRAGAIPAKRAMRGDGIESSSFPPAQSDHARQPQQREQHDLASAGRAGGGTTAPLGFAGRRAAVGRIASRALGAAGS